MDVEDIGILVVVDNDEIVLGVFTSGDFREAVFNGIDISRNVAEIINKSFLYVEQDFSEEDAISLFENDRINVLPVLNKGKLTGVVHKDEYIKEDKNIGNLIDHPVVIMGGGKGTRLAPLTSIIPKPLIPIGDKAIIELIINEFVKYGANIFYVTSVSYTHLTLPTKRIV